MCYICTVSFLDRSLEEILNTYIIVSIFRFKGTRQLDDSHKYEILKDGDTYTLIIHDVFGEDQDEYSVRATNRGGSKTSRGELEISCKYLPVFTAATKVNLDCLMIKSY